MAKNGLNAKAIAHAKWAVGLKIKYAKNVRKTVLLAHYSCSMQKTARKNSWYSKNESILKMAKNGLNAKAIAHAKWAVWGKN